ncbi:MAG: hypothetical protein GX758_01435 [Tenericutes bacterium]|nr:hypothetical protein [Mycoplasmatota bacterium]
MKKIALFLLVIGSMFLLTGCGEKNIEGSLEDLMDKVYLNIKEEDKPMMLSNIEVNNDNKEGFLGSPDIEFEEALASESMVGSIAHSVVLIRAKKGQDVEKLKTEIKQNADPRKWICVGVEDVVVESKGDLVILIMSDNLGETILENFNNLK